MTECLLPGWKILVETSSENNSKITCFHDLKGKIIIEGKNSDETFEKALLQIFNTERKDFKNWSKFLYELLLKNINPEQIAFNNYSEKAYRSWVIRGHGKLEIEFDGRDENLNLFERKPSLRALISIPSEKVTYQNLIETSLKI